MKSTVFPNFVGFGEHLQIKMKQISKILRITLSTSSLTIPSFQGDPTTFHKGILLKQTPNIKSISTRNSQKWWITFKNHEKVPFPSCPREAHVTVRLMRKKCMTKRYFFPDFWMIFIVFDHAFASPKYTTVCT